jgi:hypothetical protein
VSIVEAKSIKQADTGRKLVKVSALLHTVLGQAYLDEAVTLSGQKKSDYVARFVDKDDPIAAAREKYRQMVQEKVKPKLKIRKISLQRIT